MNIAFINATHIWSGAKTWCLINAEELSKRRHNVVIYARPGTLIDKASQQGLDAVAFPFGADFSPKAIAYFIREFKRRHIDVCICNITKDMRTAGIAARILGIPILQHIGAAGDLRDSAKERLTTRVLAPWFITPSEFVRKGFLVKYPLAAKFPLRAIHPGVSTPDVTELRTTAGTPRRIIMTSRFAEGKGHADLVRALSRLHNEGFDFVCTLCGSGELEQKIRNQVTEAELEKKVIFAGFASDVYEHLLKNDIYVFPSRNEGLGLSLIEAMAAGLPCIAKRGSGPEEIWPAERSSMLIPEEDTGLELYVQLRRLLSMNDSELINEGRVFYEHARKFCNKVTQAEELGIYLTEIVKIRGAQ